MLNISILLFLSALVFFSLYETTKVNTVMLTPPYNLYKNLLILCSLIFLLLLGGLREIGVGSDDYIYVTIFNSISNFWGVYTKDIGFTIEPGFELVVFIAKSINTDLNFVFGFILFLSLCASFIAVKISSPFVAISILFIFVHTYWFRELNQIRASLAYSLTLLAYVLISKDYKHKGYLLLAMAPFLHATALLAAVPLITHKIIKSRKMYLIFIFIAFFAGFFMKGVVLTGIEFLPLEGFFKAKVHKFLVDDGGYAKGLPLFNPAAIKYILIALYLAIIYRQLIQSNKSFRFLYSVYVTGVIWILTFREFGVFAARIASMFTYVEVVLIPISIYSFNNNLRPMVAVLSTIFALIILLLNIVVNNKAINYTSILF